MRIITFNLRFDNEKDGNNAWRHRRELVVRVINRYKPAIVGTQEGTWSQLMYLKDQLGDYRLFSSNRIFDETCQYPTLFFRSADLAEQEGSDFWLSKTPDIFLSKDWDSAFPRMMSYARFLCLKGQKRCLWVIVTHLDHVSAGARYEQAKLIANWIHKKDEPVILMGDFNDSPGSSTHRLFKDPATGLIDTWQALGHAENEDSFTHHDFNGNPRKTRMDWIFVSPDFKILEAQIIRDHEGSLYPSDHFPYLADVEI